MGKRIILYLMESVLVLLQCGGVQLFPKTVFTSSFSSPESSSIKLR